MEPHTAGVIIFGLIAGIGSAVFSWLFVVHPNLVKLLVAHQDKMAAASKKLEARLDEHQATSCDFKITNLERRTSQINESVSRALSGLNTRLVAAETQEKRND